MTRSLSRTIMVLGTASSSGKSLIAAALCRILHQDGLRVAPFKAQNMSNNSFVTCEGLEMGRAQVVQAYAAGLEPEVRMNPVLLKPSSDTGSQVVVEGKPAFTLKADNWRAIKTELKGLVHRNYQSLARDFEVIVLEGAGSPAEINLKDDDIVNMGMAEMADSPVIIVGDIDRGGVFASLVGTMQLLDAKERARVKGFVINKFRGDIGLLKPGLDQLTKLTDVPVLGVVPWIDHAIDEEDGQTERFMRKGNDRPEVDICIVRLPHISNFTDFLPLETTPGVAVRWCDTTEAIHRPDLLILPGTKATMTDLAKLKKVGIADAIRDYAEWGGTVLGICGGFQMLGNWISDPHHTESKLAEVEGLGLLDMTTTFYPDKKTVQTTATVTGDGSWLLADVDGAVANGYEIHMGASEYGSSARPITRSRDANGRFTITGIANASGRIMGTYLHGLFDSGTILAGMVNAIRRKKGLPPLDGIAANRRLDLEKNISMLASTVRTALDMETVYRIIEAKNARA